LVIAESKVLFRQMPPGRITPLPLSSTQLISRTIVGAASVASGRLAAERQASRGYPHRRLATNQVATETPEFSATRDDLVG